MASSKKESSPYLGVQKSTSGGYAVEKRRFRYQGEDYGKFYHRTDDESKAAFMSDVVHFFSRTDESKFNFGNSRKVLEAHWPRLRQELEDSLVSWGDLDRQERRKKVRGFLIDQAIKLWNDEGEILKSKPGSSQIPDRAPALVATDHSRPLCEGSNNNVVEQVSHGHEDTVQEEVRPLHKGINNSTLEQLEHHGYEECLTGEWSTTKQFEKHYYDNGGFQKFDIEVGLLQQPRPEEPKLEKKLPIPPLLKDPPGSCSQAQANPYEGVDARGRKTKQNLKSRMEQRCDGYAKWLEITYKFLKSTCSQVKVSSLLDQVASDCKTLPSVSPQMQCPLYENIYDHVKDVIDSECIPKEILDKYRAETEPIVKQCRANWHS